MAKPPPPEGYVVTKVNSNKGTMAKSKKKTPKRGKDGKFKKKGSSTKKKATKKKATKKKATKKKATKKKASKKKASKKKASKKKASAKKKKKGKPVSKKNPSSVLNLKRPFKDLAPRMVGKVLAAAAVRKFGDGGGSGPMSPTTGAAWSYKDYAIGLIASAVGGEVVGRFGGKKLWGQEIYEGGVELVTTKAIWTEVVGRVPMLQQYLGKGDVNPELRALMAKGQKGDIADDGFGNRWLCEAPGRWVSMQGTDDPYAAKKLAGDDPYAPKELSGRLTDEDYLGGVLTTQDYLDGRLTEASALGSMGHAIPKGTPKGQVHDAEWFSTGSDDPHMSAYQQ